MNEQELSRTADELRKSKRRYQRIFENIQDAYYEADLDGTILEISPSIKNVSQYRREELIGKSLYDIYTKKKERDGFLELILDKGKVNDLEISLSDKDGSRHLCSITTLLMKDERGKPVKLVGSMRDISERRQREDERIALKSQLQQAQKTEAIATLAGGVAHEFNNALMGVVGNIELLKMRFPEDERRDRYFEAMKSSTNRMSRLTDQLLAYSQGGKYQPRDLRLDDFVIETLRLLQHGLNPAARVETCFPKDILPIRADQTQIQMVLSAILSNSNEAIGEEGLIRITAENIAVDVNSMDQFPGLKPGLYTCLSIEDNGKGMSEEEKSRIFDPFFTTKFQGRGMGMAAAHGIIRNHDGLIFVNSEPGKGSVIRIFLPAVITKNRERESEMGKMVEGEER